jgi:integrase
MATIEERTKNGKTVYRVKVRRKGYSAQSATFVRITDARKWAQSTEAAMEEGRHFKTTEAKRHTLAELVDRYKREVLPRKSASSIKTQTQQLRWWTEQLGMYVLADLTPSLLAEYREKLARGNGGPRSNATVVRYMAALSHAFTIAVKEWRWLEDSPMRNVSKPRESRGRVRFLADDERGRLLDACRASDNPYLYPVVVLALATGARKMEILTLHWRDVDFQRQVITLHKTKNGERRVLPLTGHAWDLVQQRAKVRRIDSPFVFPSRNGKKAFDIRRAWESALKGAHIPDFCFHDLRHTFASYIAMNGASLMEIAELLGHKTLAMVKRYAHLSEAHTAGVVARMNEKIFAQAM